jgi:hypothetical protein
MTPNPATSLNAAIHQAWPAASDRRKACLRVASRAFAACLLFTMLSFALGCRGKSGSQANDGYAPNLVFSNLQMSESTSLSGGKSTFLDGTVRNNGPQSVTHAQLQAAFANDEAMPPQRLLVPLTVIRAREPYIDTQPVSAAPLAPGSQRDFRLIFEDIDSNWNQSLPQLSVLHVTTACNPCR